MRNEAVYTYGSIKNVPEELRPREKLKRLGAEKLSDEELLAIILRTGTKDKDVLSVARELLALGWDRLEGMSLGEIANLKGVGEVKATQVKALLELSKRIREPFGDRRILTPEDAVALLRDLFRKDRESLIALYLDLSHRVIRVETVAVGSLNRVFVKPKDILKPAVELSAYGILIAHNHPQGVAEPSKDDISFTHNLRKSCTMLGFELLDHIILDRFGFFSFREKGLIG